MQGVSWCGRTLPTLGLVLQEPPNALYVTNADPRLKTGICCYSNCSAGKIFPSIWRARELICLITLAFGFSRGVCSFPGLSADGCRAVPTARSQLGSSMQDMRGQAVERGQAEFFKGCFYMKAPGWPWTVAEEADGEL